MHTLKAQHILPVDTAVGTSIHAVVHVLVTGALGNAQTTTQSIMVRRVDTEVRTLTAAPLLVSAAASDIQGRVRQLPLDPRRHADVVAQTSIAWTAAC